MDLHALKSPILKWSVYVGNDDVNKPAISKRMKKTRMKETRRKKRLSYNFFMTGNKIMLHCVEVEAVHSGVFMRFSFYFFERELEFLENTEFRLPMLDLMSI